MMKVYNSTSRMMTEVDGGASHMMKVRGATENILINSIIMSVIIDMRWYISRQKVLLKMKEVCGAISHKMKELIVRKHQVDGTQLLIYFTYM